MLGFGVGRGLKALLIPLLLCSGAGVAGKNTPTITLENTPTIASLIMEMAGVGRERVRSVIVKRLGPPARDMGSGLIIEEWDVDGGVLVYHPLAGPMFEKNGVTECLLRPASLADGVWTFRVDRMWNGERMDEPFTDEDFRQTPVGRSYGVVIRGNGALIEITEPGRPPMRGARDAKEPARYNLDEGTFGGSFSVTWSASGRMGELILYGSGVPVFQAERGTLERAR